MLKGMMFVTYTEIVHIQVCIWGRNKKGWKNIKCGKLENLGKEYMILLLLFFFQLFSKFKVV
jgi:hypothetical protein